MVYVNLNILSLLSRIIYFIYFLLLIFVTGVKNTAFNSTKINPSGIYANINGTRGHFITKEIEVNQGHSKMKTYRPNDLQVLNEFNKSDRNIYVDSQTNIDNIPFTVLQPPPITNNHPSGSNNILRNTNNSFGGHRTHRYHWIYNSSANFGNLSPSGNIYFQLSQFYLSQFHSMII